MDSRTRHVGRLPRAVGIVLGVALGAAAVALAGCSDGTVAPVGGFAGMPPGSEGGFTLSVLPTTVEVLPGGVAKSRVVLTRDGGFAGSIALAVTGAPAGLTATVEPSATTGTTATLVVTAGAGVTTGDAVLTVVATAAGRAAQTATVRFGVAPRPGGAGNARVDFSACADGDSPVWFAFQDGAGAWTQIVDDAGVYRFEVASDKGGYAYATTGSGRVLVVAYATRDELTRSAISVCPVQGRKSVSGTFAGLGPRQVAYVGLGEPNPDPERQPLSARSFTLTGIGDGAQDLVAYRSESPRPARIERAVIRRDQQVVHGATLGVIDFEGAESFAPATARVTVTGAAGLPVAHWMSYFTGPTCALHDLYYDESGGTALTMRGIPAALQRATDMHRLDVYTTAGGGFRAASEVFHALADRVVAFPQELPAPAISAPPGGHRRVAASVTLPAEYRNGEVLLFMYAYGERGAFAYVRATPGWLGGADVTLAVPDLSGAPGWNDAFLPPPDASVGWILQATGSTGAPAGGGVCAENARFVIAYVGGRS